MKTTPGTPRKTNAKSQTRSSLDNTKESSDDADFTLVSYSRNSSGTARSTRTAIEKKLKLNTVEGNEMKMISVMAWRFREFQKKIFPIIHSITKASTVKDHPFIKKWEQALKQNINDSSTLRTVLKALDLNNINEYDACRRSKRGQMVTMEKMDFGGTQVYSTYTKYKKNYGREGYSRVFTKSATISALPRKIHHL
jgi:hypothetical protein